MRETSVDSPRPAAPAGELFDNSSVTNDFGLLSVEQVAVSLGKQPQTIRNMVARRELPYVRLGNRTVFLWESVRDWLKEKEVKPHGSI